jgi:hypothetical protein
MHYLAVRGVAKILLSGLVSLAVGAHGAGKSPPKQPAKAQPARDPSSVLQSQSGILYGKEFAYALSAPPGWVMDDATGRAQGMSAVFYRRGESWDKGDAVMYANVAAKVKGQDDTLEKVIKYDIEQTKKNNPDTTAQRVQPLPTKDGRKAVTYAFSMAGTGASREKLAYIDTPKVVVMLALTGHSDTAYNQALPDFARLVNSFVFMTNNVQFGSIKNNPAKGRKKTR